MMWLACLSFPPVAETLTLGQDSTMLLLVLCLALRDFKLGREGRAGAILALGLFRYQLLVVPLMFLVIKRRWLALRWFFVVALGLVVISLLLVGWQGCLDYANLVLNAATFHNQHGVYPTGMYNLKAFFLLVLGPEHWFALLVSLVLTTSGLLILLYQTSRGPWQPDMPRFDLQVSLLIVVTLLSSPHLYRHDLVLLIIPGFLVMNACHSTHCESMSKWLRFLPLVVFLGLFASFLYSTSIDFQIGVVFMLLSVFALAYEVARVSASDPGG